MSKFTKELINDYANKLLIGLSDEENETIKKEFEIIESNMNLITKIKDIDLVEPMHFPFSIDCKLRDGKDFRNEEVNDLLKNCDKVNDREIEVPKVVG